MRTLAAFILLTLPVATATADAPSPDPQLAQVLDQWLPLRPGPYGPGREGVLIGQLAHDDAVVRERATQELINMGITGSGLIEQACDAEEPEIRLRALRVARTRGGDRPPIDWAERIREEVAPIIQRHRDPASLRLMADRAIAVLRAGPPARGPNALIVQELLTAVAKSKDEALADRFRPLLKHADVRVAVLVTRAIGQSQAGSDYYPPFLLHALASGRPEVVEAALRSGPAPITDQRRLPAVHAACRTIFGGDNDRLRFAAGFILMQSFHDADVYPYLLEQAHCPNRGRRSDALDYLGDPCNLGRPAWPALIETVRPLAASDDVNDRRAAVRILRCYTGKETASMLLPLLADPQSIVVSEAQDGLVQRPDVETIGAALDHALSTSQNRTLRPLLIEVRAQLRRSSAAQ